MHWINWAIVAVYLVVVVFDGLRRTRGTTNIEGYFLANRSLPWWAVGLSVMATQLSAVTLIGTTGQGATDGLRFVQFYFGLPIAMVILGVTIVPFLHGAKVYTAYEFLEKRFDAKTRSLTSFLFLLSRGMSCGTIIAAPSVVLSAIFGWDITWCVALIGIPTVIYTVLGGVQAVTWADVKQMVVIVGALLATVVDFYQRWFKRKGTDAHYLFVSKASTAVWGVFACVVAVYAANLGSLIEVVNRFGSFFYGSILGVFILAMIPRTRAFGAFVGLLSGMGAVAAVSFGVPSVSFLWHNVIGAVVVVAVGSVLSLGDRKLQTGTLQTDKL